MVYTHFRDFAFYLYKNYLDHITVEYSKKIVSDKDHFLRLYYHDLPENDFYCLRTAMEQYLKSIYTGDNIQINKFYEFEEAQVEKFSLRVNVLKSSIIEYLIFYSTDINKISEVIREMNHFYAVQEGLILKDFFALRQQEIEAVKKALDQKATTPAGFDDKSLISTSMERSFIELEAKDNNLKMAYSELDDFINKVYIELKAPVSNIEGLIKEMMLEIASDRGEAEVLIQMLTASLTQIKKTIEFLIQISEIYNTDLIERKQSINFSDVLDEVLDDLYPELSDINLNVEREFQISTVHFPKKQLKSVMLNLLLNSFKFRTPGKNVRIVIKTQIKKGNLLLSFCDNGIGISPKDHKRIFQVFKKAHNIEEGLGGGLYLVKSIMEKNNGKIEVQSEPGCGTIFNLFFKTSPH
ncbi:phytochrome-like protein cph1 [Sporocytophaga myxococcoides]|uniref:histidine kinase n=1 Tax=Sporocytophaga myxococcoides TaxID=153721 RepID=A0A098LEV9_9BACT|nr:HAMP domain-containing sensor histidine kinase [Sporocytophaga myxococcoides]GAL85470.1 phytochrome-like protein cph1 [Sporocytophaga myxococcoides]